LGCGSSCIGRINCIGWPELMDRIKMVVLSIWRISHPNFGKGQARITRKVCVKDLDAKYSKEGVLCWVCLICHPLQQ
jgi:hypothetical protein